MVRRPRRRDTLLDRRSGLNRRLPVQQRFYRGCSRFDSVELRASVTRTRFHLVMLRFSKEWGLTTTLRRLPLVPVRGCVLSPRVQIDTGQETAGSMFPLCELAIANDLSGSGDHQLSGRSVTTFSVMSRAVRDIASTV